MSAAGGAQPAGLRELAAQVLPEEVRGQAREQTKAFALQRLKEADQADAQAWSRVHDATDWAAFRESRLRALKASLGDFPAAGPLKIQTTGTRAGDGFVITGLTYTSRAGDAVPALLYTPEPRRERMPGILLCHSHHRPKVQGELQDMGMTWARAGSCVLVPDLPTYGQRRHQPYPGRQEYYFRYYVGMQLQLAGESLIGRIVWDLWRGVDVLLKQPDIDASRIMLMGSVAGGGDPAAVAAALDERIACVVPFNFGGPQPETIVASQSDAAAFRYTGSGGWESTRNLRYSARDGFLPWVIVGGVAPRALCYAHEFEWTAEADPVWARLQQVYAWHDAGDRLGSLHGKGQVTQSADVATHCNQIGAVHRAQLHPQLEKWFDIPQPQEYSARIETEALEALIPMPPLQPLHLQVRERATAKLAALQQRVRELSPTQVQETLRTEWSRVLRMPPPCPVTSVLDEMQRLPDGSLCRRVVLETEPGITVPLVLLLPAKPGNAPTVVGLAQHGKARFFEERGQELGALLARGIAVCLPDLRGWGETDPDGERTWAGQATRDSSSELMLGRTQLGNQLHDLLAVLTQLERTAGVDAARIALWGDSFAPVNPPDYVDPPLRQDGHPAIGEPAGGLLALLGALFQPRTRGGYARRTLASWLTLLDTPFVHLPHDFLVPDAVEAGEPADLARALGPRAVLAEPIDGRNHAVDASVAAPHPALWLAERLHAPID